MQQVSFAPAVDTLIGDFLGLIARSKRRSDIHVIRYNRNSYITSRLQKLRTSKRRATVSSTICNLLFETFIFFNLSILHFILHQEKITLTNLWRGINGLYIKQRPNTFIMVFYISLVFSVTDTSISFVKYLFYKAL